MVKIFVFPMLILDETLIRHGNITYLEQLHLMNLVANYIFHGLRKDKENKVYS